MDNLKRCDWASNQFELYREYHDEEWGVPVYDDKKLFEFLVLEGAQAGLSWSTILKRREGYRKAFNGFDVKKVAEFNAQDVKRLMNDTGIIRNRKKIEATIQNARVFISIQQEFGSFSAYIWKFVNHKPIQNHFKALKEIAISKDLKKRGMNFVGPTIMYAHMQATGMVNDHLVDCFRHSQLQNLSGK